MANIEAIQAMKRELQEVRSASLEATRRGDFMKVARLTAQAAQINKALMDAEGFAEAARVGANPYEARRK